MGASGGCKFAEPVALSSPEPTDLPLARTASRLGFDLLALRARRRKESTSAGRRPFKLRAGESVHFAGDEVLHISTLPTATWGEAGGDETQRLVQKRT